MKTVFFLRGVSGSGKSTLAETLSNMNDNSYMVAADDYFTKNGTYNFVQDDIGKAHKWCIATVREYLSIEHPAQTVIIHNTSISNHDVLFYKDLADEFNATFYSLIVENRHGKKNVHNVPDSILEKQALTLLNNINVLDGLTYNTNKAKPRDYSKLEVIEFLRQFSDLDEGLVRLKNEFLISSTKLNGKVLLKYDEGSNKNEVIVRECRGLILSEKDLSIVSIPFEKFGNFGEPYAAKIDFDSSKIVEKLDGSCFCLYYDQVNEKWCSQTLGQIEAEEFISGWGAKKNEMTWSDLFWRTFATYEENIPSLLNRLSKNFTYIFELCSPMNKVVVRHEKARLIFTGIRNKKTLLETETSTSILYEIFEKPKVYEFKNLRELRRVCAEELTSQEEGFILVDANFERNKMKSYKYIEEHYSATTQTLNSLTRIVFQHEEEEYLSIYPEYSGYVNIIKSELDRMGTKIDSMFENILSQMIDKTDKKEFASFLLKLEKNYLTKFLFELFHKKHKNGKAALTYSKSATFRIYDVRNFLLNSNVKSQVSFNEETNSIR